jgi:dihydroorotate dehydrogenase electron transfer subunit
MGTIKTARARVMRIEWMSPDTFLIGLGGTDAAGTTFPGQFFMLKCGGDLSPLWRRPFSICDLLGEELLFMVRTYGRGSRHLASRRVGDEVALVGPLGRPLEVDDAEASHVLVAGGIGLAPFPLVARRLLEANPASDIVLIYGEKTASAAVDPTHLLPGVRIVVTTDDGSLGKKGTAVQVLAEYLEATPVATVVACGPRPMLKAIQEHPAARGVRLVFFMEELMACGFGTCMGCVTGVRDGDRTTYVRICREGPVMDGRRVVL